MLIIEEKKSIFHMAIPHRDQIKPFIIELIKDGKVHTVDELYDYIISEMHLSKQDLEIMNPGGYEQKYKNEIRWAKEELKNDGLLFYPKKSEFQITEEAKNQLTENYSDTSIFDSYSWTVYKNTVAVKKTDKSFFLHHGTGIPKNVRPFFQVEYLSKGEKREIILYYHKNIFTAKIELDNLNRTRLFFYKDFQQILHSKYPQWLQTFKSDTYSKNEPPKVRFSKLRSNEYNIEFFDENSIQKDIENEINDELIYRSNKEGSTKIISSKFYERNPINRQLAIEIHGLTCKVCGFNFEEKYGELGQGFIEIHHIIPLHEIKSETDIYPERDLIPVCPNCHRMLHRNKKTLSIEELRTIIDSDKKST